jgi:hypothetical protein
MPVRRQDVLAALSVHDPGVLRAILEAAQISLRGAESAPELAARVTDALWWNYSSPLGYVIEASSLDDIVAHVAKKLRVSGMSEGGDAWARLRELTVLLARQTASRIDVADPSLGVRLDDLDPAVQARLSPSWMPTAFAASSGATAVGAGMVGKLVVKIGKSPVGRLLPLIPSIGPVWRGVRTVGGVAAVVGTPLGIALSVVALHESLGTNYHRLVPLLLGIGALGPSAVTEAEEIPV